MPDRPNSLLTNSQRRKLLDGDKEEYNRQHRQRIRERTRNGTKDLSLLFDRMEDRDIKQVFEPDREALSKTAELIQEITSSIEQLGRRSSIEQRHALQEVSDIIDEVEVLSDEEESIEADLEGVRTHARDDSSSDSRERRDELEIELRNVAAHREELVNDLEMQLDEIDETLGQQSGLLDEAHTRFQQIPQKELSLEWQRQLDVIGEQFTARRKQAEELVQIIDEVHGALQNDRMPLEDLFYLRDRIEKHTGKGRVQDRSHSQETPPLRILLRRFQRELDAELDEPEFDPGLQDEFVRAMAFFFRVSEVLGTDTEELIEEAYVKMFEQEHADEVLDHVVMTAEADSRETAADRGAAKAADGYLSNAELRALAETDPETLVQRHSQGVDVTEDELAVMIDADPEVLERGLEIEDTNPRNPGSTAVPDMVARDNRSRIVVMEFKTDVAAVNGAVEELQQFVQDYGGEDRVRGMLVVPESIVDEVEESVDRLGKAIEIRAVPVDLTPAE